MKYNKILNQKTHVITILSNLKYSIQINIIFSFNSFQKIKKTQFRFIVFMYVVVMDINNPTKLNLSKSDNINYFKCASSRLRHSATFYFSLAGNAYITQEVYIRIKLTH
jgi:predicted membrane-bound spermidine synthase